MVQMKGLTLDPETTSLAGLYIPHGSDERERDF